MFRLKWLWNRLTNRLWLRPALYAALALFTPAIAYLVQDLLPTDLPVKIGAEAVSQILNILASSLLAVATFSLGTMVSAYSAAANMATPRATRLLLTDSTSQQVLATFIGTFLFALVSIIILNTGAYSAQGQVVLFGMTLIMVSIVVVTLVRWVDFLARFGRYNDTVGRVEAAATKALLAHRRAPFLNARPLPENFKPQENWAAVEAGKTGYVQAINVEALHNLAEKLETEFYVTVRPGTFVHPKTIIAYSVKGDAKALTQKVCACLFVGRERSFEQDPRFGLAVLSEIGCRALSPSVNDSGTAIDVIGRALRCLLDSLDEAQNEKRAETHNQKPMCSLVYVPQLSEQSLLGNFFLAIMRDAGNRVEVHIRLQKTLLALRECQQELFGALASDYADRALQWFQATHPPATDLQSVQQIHARIGA